MKKTDNRKKGRSASPPRPGKKEADLLPDSYGEDRVVLLPVEPYMAHVYWDLEEKKKRIPAKAQPLLRFHDITGGSTKADPSASFDVEIDLRTGDWYVPLWSPGRSYSVELGLKNGKGRFRPLARSNEAHFPPAQLAEEEAEELMLVMGNAEKGLLIIRNAEGALAQQEPSETKIEEAEPEEKKITKAEQEKISDAIPPVPPVFFSAEVISFMKEKEEEQNALPYGELQPLSPEDEVPMEMRKEKGPLMRRREDITTETERLFRLVSASPMAGYERAER
ncbi:MAG: DUF4912 domain-containing protein [Nitrospirales bacterium]|nr:DUF4912 domain-containing protein [Nitrospirales bacterium]